MRNCDIIFAHVAYNVSALRNNFSFFSYTVLSVFDVKVSKRIRYASVRIVKSFSHICCFFSRNCASLDRFARDVSCSRKFGANRINRCRA